MPGFPAIPPPIGKGGGAIVYTFFADRGLLEVWVIP